MSIQRLRWLGILTALVSVSRLDGQTTRPERTAFRETSSYPDVLAFLDSLQMVTREIRVGMLGTSPEGRRIPYVIAARPLVRSPAEAHRTGKLLVYLQANIHAGEVEGKEAAQMLLRDLTAGRLRGLLDEIVLLVVPMYNTDGNERWGPGEQNRPGQNGPARVGRNPNGQGLNLNRDYIKMEAPETRGSVALLKSWDPDLFIDLHTTNGSYHGYALTYASGLNPNSNAAVDFVRDRLLPQVRRRMEQRYQQRTFSYGNFRSQHPDSLAQGWETYDARARFGTNWMGLRGRLSILSEGYSNADFRSRISATYNFVREVLELAGEQTAAIKQVVRTADRTNNDSLAIRSRLGSPVFHEVIAEITGDAGEGSNGFARRQRTGEYRAVRMPVYDRFTATRKEARPAAYLIPSRLTEIIDLLLRQGIAVDVSTSDWRTRAEAFTVDSIAVGPLFEGHRTIQVEGRWSTQPVDTLLSSGWYLVRTDQPLGTLAGYLLEPASEDGVVTWNFLDRELEPRAVYPILRAHRLPPVPSTALP